VISSPHVGCWARPEISEIYTFSKNIEIYLFGENLQKYMSAAHHGLVLTAGSACKYFILKQLKYLQAGHAAHFLFDRVSPKVIFIFFKKIPASKM
jgi:hypothetical protein